MPPSLLLLGLLGFFGTPLHAAEPLPPADARLTKSQGAVTVRTPLGETDIRALHGYPPLEQGDWVKTGTRGTADISINGRTLIRLQEGSAVRLSRMTPKSITFYLAYGVLLAKVQFDKSDGSRFAVISPNALTTVRGTEFVVEEMESRARVAVLDEGHVAVMVPGNKKENVLHFNQEIQVRRRTPLEDPRVLERLYHYKQPMSEIRERIKVVRKAWKPLSVTGRQRLRAAAFKRRPSPTRSSTRSSQ